MRTVEDKRRDYLTNKIEIRTIETKDNAAIQNLVQKILKKHQLDIPGTAYYDPYLGELTEYYAGLQRAEYWVLTLDEKVIGGVGIAPFNDAQEVAELQKFYIEEAYQGYGYGGKLFNHAKQFAIANGYRQLYLETTDVLAKANKIYEYYGFKKMEAPLNGSEHDAMNTWYLLELYK
jgi:putative acetyltransferase